MQTSTVERGSSMIVARVRLSSSGEEVELRTEPEVEGDGLKDIKLCNVDASNSRTVGVDDLIRLTHLHEPAILDVLCMRYASNIIYTYTGGSLV